MVPDGYALRPLSIDDAAGLAAAYDRNREHLARWDPERPEWFYTEAGQTGAIEKLLELNAKGLFECCLVIGSAGEIVGRANLQNLVRGMLQSGTLSYWVDKDHLRRGLARAAVQLLEERARELSLHRLEAATAVENRGSQRVLESLGFQRYGLAPGMLFINGDWQDQVLFQKLLHERPLGEEWAW